MMSPSARKSTAFIASTAAIILAAVLLFLLSGTEQDNSPIRFAYQNRIGSAACVVAAESDYFTQEGVKTETFCFNSGPACAEALYSGSADIATMGDTTAIIAVARDNRFAIIASHGQGERRHRLMVGPTSSAQTIEDLRGKTLGVKKGTSTYGGLLLLLASRQIAPSEIHIIDMTPAEMPDALTAGSIDGFVASEPTPSLAEQRGARQLTTLGGLGNTYPILILARRDLLRNRPDQVTRFLHALQRAEETIRTDPNGTAATLARITGLPPEVTHDAMARHRYALCIDAAIVESLHQTATFLQTQGTISSPPDFDRAIDATHLQTMHSSPPMLSPNTPDDPGHSGV